MSKQQKTRDTEGTTLTLRLKADLLKRARAYADEQERSVAFVVRKALEAYLEGDR